MGSSQMTSRTEGTLQFHGRGCNMEVPFIAMMPSNAKEFGMAHKEVDAFHACAFLRVRCCIMIFSLTWKLMTQPSITLLICTRSSIAIMMRWKKLEFGVGYIGSKVGVNRGKNILDGDVRAIGRVDFDCPWKIGGYDGNVRTGRDEG